MKIDDELESLENKVAALKSAALISIVALNCIKTEFELGNPDDAVNLINRALHDIRAIGDKLDIDLTLLDIIDHDQNCIHCNKIFQTNDRTAVCEDCFKESPSWYKQCH